MAKDKKIEDRPAVHPSITSDVDEVSKIRSELDALSVDSSTVNSDNTSCMRQLHAKAREIFGAGEAPSLVLDFQNNLYMWAPDGARGGNPMTVRDWRVFTDVNAFLADIGGTFSRSTTATYFNKNGVLKTATAGEPRLNHRYDAAIGRWVPAGYMNEPSRINLALYSEDFVSGKSGASVTVTADTTTAPDGNATADSLTGTAGQYWYHTINGLAVNSDYVASVFAKKGTAGHQFRIEVQFSGGTQSAHEWADVDLGTGVIVTVPTSWTAGIEDCGSWWRIWLVGNALDNTSAVFHLRPNMLDTSALTAVVWGLQFEEGDYPTSYIPTSGTAVMRAADIMTIPTAGWVQGTLGSMLWHGQFTSDPALLSSNRIILSLTPAVNASKHNIILYNGNTKVGSLYCEVNNSQAAYLAGTASDAAPHSVAVSFSSSRVARSEDGATTASATPTAWLESIDTLNIGWSGGHGVTTERIIYYPVELSDYDLQALSS